MLKSYINYPNPTISRYTDPNSAQIGKRKKIGQRYIQITQMNLSSELNRFETKQYKFSNEYELRDMWLEIELNDPLFELAVLAHIQQLVGKHYPSLGPTRTAIHDV